MCGVAAYFIEHQKHIQTILFTLRRIIGAYRGKQIAKIIIKVILEFGFRKRLSIYINNNAKSNDTIQKTVLNILHLDRDLKASHSHYLGHIINLATKAFIFGKNIATFKVVIDTVNNVTPQDSPTIRATQNEWRKRKALEKLYNVIIFIQVLSQRRKAFRKITVNKLSDYKFILPLKTLIGEVLSLAILVRLKVNRAR